MKKAEAEKYVRALAEDWKHMNPVDAKSAGAPMLFWGWLRKNHPHLLNFRCSGDQYQVIAGWYGREMSGPWNRH